MKLTITFWMGWLAVCSGGLSLASVIPPADYHSAAIYWLAMSAYIVGIYLKDAKREDA
jgi:hypothetical protein